MVETHNDFIHRLARLESTVDKVEEDLQVLRMEAKDRRAELEEKLKSNAEKLDAIQKILTQMSVYMTIGKWVMYTVSAIGGAAGLALFEYLLGVKH